MKGFPLEFGIGVMGPECFYDGAIRWSKKFSDRFSRFDTIPAVTDSHPASHPSSHVAVAITLNAKASSLKSYQRIFDEIFWRGVVYSLEEVNRLDNSKKFTAFEALDISEKNIVSTAQSPLRLYDIWKIYGRLSRPLSIGEGKLLGRLPNEARRVENRGRRPRAEWGMGRVSKLPAH